MEEERENNRRLVEKAQMGDRRALEVLFTRYREQLLPLVRARLGPELRAHVDSQDIVNSVMGDAIQGLPQFDCKNEAALLHWLGKIAANKVCNKARYYGTLKRGGGAADIRGSAGAELLAAKPGNEAGPREIAEGREAHERIYDALDKLNASQREVLLLARIQRLSIPQIAQILACTEAAARMRVTRALEALTHIYASGNEGE